MCGGIERSHISYLTSQIPNTMETTQSKTTIKGGEFLTKETPAQDVFIPEEYTEEQRMIADTCRDFIGQEVWPILDRIDAQEEGLMPSLLDKAAELGLL